MRSNLRRANQTDEETQATRQPDALSELENLHYQLGRIESFAWAAVEALGRLPRAGSSEGRQAMRRLDHLVVLTAEDVAEALSAVEKAVDSVHHAAVQNGQRPAAES